MLIVLKTAWQRYWMTREFPENAERFAVDFYLVIETALKLLGTQNGTPKLGNGDEYSNSLD